MEPKALTADAARLVDLNNDGVAGRLQTNGLACYSETSSNRENTITALDCLQEEVGYAIGSIQKRAQFSVLRLNAPTWRSDTNKLTDRRLCRASSGASSIVRPRQVGMKSLNRSCTRLH